MSDIHLGCPIAPGLIAAVALAALLAGACSASNPAYCDERTECGDGRACNLDANRCVEGTARICQEASDCTDPAAPLCVEGICGECESSSDCSAAAPLCGGAPDHVCTGCESAADCALYAGQPTCHMGACVGCAGEADCAAGEACDAQQGQCRPCVANGDCESRICQVADGACLMPEQVVYVSPDGIDRPGCNLATPCLTVSFGVNQLAPGRPYLHLAAGQYVENLELDAITATLVAEPGAELHGARADLPVALLAGGAIEIEGLTVVGHENSTSGGIHATSGRHELRGVVTRENGTDGLSVSGDAEVSFIDSSAAGNGANGVSQLGGRLDVLRGQLIDNDDFGYIVTGGQADLQATSIAENRAGGLVARDAEIDVINCLIHHNTSASFPPVYCSIYSDSGSGRVVHTTIVANLSGNDNTSGILCGGAFDVLLRNNIIHGNTGPSEPVDGPCEITYSLLGPTVEQGVGNVLGTPRFVDLEGGDLHLMPDSPGVDDGTSGDADVDLDGDSRPLGAAPDMGADEVPAR